MFLCLNLYIIWHKVSMTQMIGFYNQPLHSRSCCSALDITWWAMINFKFSILLLCMNVNSMFIWWFSLVHTTVNTCIQFSKSVMTCVRFIWHRVSAAPCSMCQFCPVVFKNWNLEKLAVEHLYDCVGLYTRFYMFLCMNPYTSMIGMAGLYDPEIDFYGPCKRNLSQGHRNI
jgi:hypothetical protein